MKIKSKGIELILFLVCINFSFSQNSSFSNTEDSLETQIKALEKAKKKDYVFKDNKIKFRAYPKNDVRTLKSSFESIGASNCKIYGKYLIGCISLNKLDEIKGITDLKMITPVSIGHSATSISGVPFDASVTTGVTTTQGDRAMLTDVFRNTNQVNGCGLKIGVLSDSYDTLGGATAGITNGDLPGVGNPNGFTTPVTVLQEGSGTRTDEGRAMIEIIHDIAPGAEIFFYAGNEGIEDFADGFIALADAGVDIIVDDIFYFVEPYFQEGIVTQAIDEVSDRGVTVFTINGNIETQFSYQESFNAESITTNFSGDTTIFHDFGRGTASEIDNFFTINNIPILPIQVPANTEIRLQFLWDEPSIFANPSGPNPVSNLGVVVYEDDPNSNIDQRINNGVFVSSATTNGNPYFFYRFSSGDSVRNLKIAIFSGNGSTPQNLKIFEVNQNVQIDTLIDDPTAFFHAGTLKGITIGAVRYGDTPVFGSTLIPDPFNLALGGQQILLDRDGNRINAPQVINKPDFMAIDAGNNSFFGVDVSGPQDDDTFPNFFGTSAAAPHAAAATALILEAFKKTSNRKLLPAEIKLALNNTATDMLANGFDFQSGNGFINVEAALQELVRNEAPLSISEFSESGANGKVKFISNYQNKQYSLVDLPSNTNSVEVFNLSGKRVYSNQKIIGSQLELNFNNLISDVYILKITAKDNSVITRKVVF